MLLVRPIKSSDLPDLQKLAASAKITSLPADANHLKKKIDASLRAFDEKIHHPGSESYLFALEDTETGKLAGCSGIIAKVGGFKPFYTYRIKTETCADPGMKVSQDIRVLHLMENHDGPTEVCSLYVAPKYRKTASGRLLSLCRFLFIAEFPTHFEKNVISEMRGICDAKGKSPFWEGVGRHFFATDFAYADFLSGLGHKDFIKNLMPKYPIYTAMLPAAVQKVIGRVHKNSEPALQFLLKEGFKIQDEVDIFDAGPTVAASLEDIRSIRDSVKTTLDHTTTGAIDSDDYLVCNTSLDFRCCIAKIEKEPDGSIVLTSEATGALNLREGDEVRFVTLR